MKGVILGICPDARLVDLTHDVAPQDVEAGALVLEQAVDFFPADTVHLAVVDPGVGSTRRALAVKSNGRVFVGPDNGLFSFIFAGSDWSAVSIEALEYRRLEVSRTFHGRDIFAPAAAHLASGLALDRLGPTVSNPVRISRRECGWEGGVLIGEVVGADRFGNLLTNVTAEAIGTDTARPDLEVVVDDRRVGPLATSYSAISEGHLGAIIGSSGRLEIFARNGDAAARFGVRRGAVVRVENKR
jgi:S-adenosylmethionine hydrolase